MVGADARHELAGAVVAAEGLEVVNELAAVAAGEVERCEQCCGVDGGRCGRRRGGGGVGPGGAGAEHKGCGQGGCCGEQVAASHVRSPSVGTQGPRVPSRGIVRGRDEGPSDLTREQRCSEHA